MSGDQYEWGGAGCGAENPVHGKDLHATVMHLMGIDHARFTFRYQGLDFRLSGVEPARVVKEGLV